MSGDPWIQSQIDTKDSFTELEARSKQYEYYRDSLLSLENLTNRLGKESVKLLPLNDVCAKISSGGTPKRNFPGYFGGSIPWIRSTDLNFKTIGAVEGSLTESGLDNSSAKLIPAGTVLVAMAGATVAKSGITTVEATTNQNCCALEADLKQVKPKFLFHLLCDDYEVLKNKAQGTQQFLNMTRIKQHEIPVPPLAEQERIVAILDKFDALVNDLSSGLPAEIAARRKQYEYYRDQLLTFTPNNSRTANLSRATAS
ncbi:restriction endonuclease subunit S [Varibaculum cambriense]|uniref:restriction endonuclease subunit S n=1 Tax=Varibaculum cambriense TaxID=184870 RepID=UPI000C7AA88E|nr:restriction endonuclease subunit S [Varibaculum cambriense]